MFSVTQNKSLLLIIVTNSILGVLLSVFLNTCLVISVLSSIGMNQRLCDWKHVQTKTRWLNRFFLKSRLSKKPSTTTTATRRLVRGQSRAAMMTSDPVWAEPGSKQERTNHRAASEQLGVRPAFIKFSAALLQQVIFLHFQRRGFLE